MDIHKPKPWRGWSELVKEIGTIVIGVLIALGAEQGVEWLHWRHAVDDARAGMARDAKNIIDEAGLRESQSSCLAREFTTLRALLDRAGQTGRLDAVSGVSEPPRSPWTLSSYDAVVSGGSLPHMAVDERSHLTGMSIWSGYLQRNRDEEVRAWNTLRTLEGPGRPIGENEVHALRSALSTAMYQETLMRQGAWLFAHRIVESKLLKPDALLAAWKTGQQHGEDRFACAGPGDDPSDAPNQISRLTQPVPPPSATRPPWL
jgi:hypothetical protein